MRGKNRLLTGVALGALLMSATNSDAVAQQPQPAGTLTVGIDGVIGDIGIYSGLVGGAPSFGFLPPATVPNGLILSTGTMEPTDNVISSVSFETAAGDMISVALGGDPDPFIQLIQGFLDAGVPSMFVVSTGVVAITPVFGLASWSRNATIDVLAGGDNRVTGTRAGGTLVELDINGIPLDFLLANPVPVGGNDKDPPPPPLGNLTTSVVNCGIAGCTGLSLTFGAMGPGANTTTGVSGSFTIQAQSILMSIPEPATLSLVGLALIGLGGALCRRHPRSC